MAPRHRPPSRGSATQAWPRRAVEGRPPDDSVLLVAGLRGAGARPTAPPRGGRHRPTARLPRVTSALIERLPADQRREARARRTDLGTWLRETKQSRSGATRDIRDVPLADQAFAVHRDGLERLAVRAEALDVRHVGAPHEPLRAERVHQLGDRGVE